MKHTLKITLIIIGIFFLSQIIGLFIVDKYIDYAQTTPEARAAGNITWQQLPYSIERPEVDESNSYLFIIAAIVFGTVILLVLVKFKVYRLWKFWYLISVLLCLSIAFAAFISQTSAFFLGLFFALIKIFKPNIFVHNFTELFIYGGLAAIFVPIINLYSVVILLILISGYDFWAVYKSKHMVQLAKFQTDTKMFAGLFIPYELSKSTITSVPSSSNLKIGRSNFAKINKQTKAQQSLKTKSVIQQSSRNAILGGGDVGFPLIFAGVIMKSFGMQKAFVIPFVTAIALLLLLLYSKKDKFYPAMPALTLGCFIGYILILFI
ncbi:hypothetical protein J4206_02535 [Candidatus Woesearchaeota archaeon]|nr:hypothetical protein [Candidatus Woesearchaeota archaeon]